MKMEMEKRIEGNSKWWDWKLGRSGVEITDRNEGKAITKLPLMGNIQHERTCVEDFQGGDSRRDTTREGIQIVTSGQ